MALERRHAVLTTYSQLLYYIIYWPPLVSGAPREHHSYSPELVRATSLLIRSELTAALFMIFPMIGGPTSRSITITYLPSWLNP